MIYIYVDLPPFSVIFQENIQVPHKKTFQCFQEKNNQIDLLGGVCLSAYDFISTKATL